MYAFPDRTRKTFLETIKACIRPGSTIYSDQWKSYAEVPHLEGYDFEHYTVNHHSDPIS